MRLQQISEALGVNIALFFEAGEGIPKVTDLPTEYAPKEHGIENFKPLDKEEITLLRLFRKIKNKKIREGILKQLRGIRELENSE